MQQGQQHDMAKSMDSAAATATIYQYVAIGITAITDTEFANGTQIGGVIVYRA